MIFRILTALFCAVAATDVAAQDAEGRTEQFNDWTLQCVTQDTGEACVMMQLITPQDQTETLLRIELGAQENGSMTGLIVVPFGLDVTKGVSLMVDGGARFNLPFRTCRDFGCVVPVTLSAGLVEQLKAAEQIMVTLYALNDQGNLNIPVSLAGFSAGFDAL